MYNNPIREALTSRRNAPGQVILLGDFNLRHPEWAGPRWPTRDVHRAGSDLLTTTRLEGLHLLTVPGTITRQGPVGRPTTIDLAFATLEIMDLVVK